MKLSLLFLGLFLVATSSSGPAPESIMELLLKARQDRISTLVQAIQAAGLAETLQKEGPFTLFAPTNDAFKKLPEDSVAKLTANPTELKKFLLHHVVKGNIPVTELKSGDLIAMDGGISRITVSAPDNITVDKAKIYTAMNLTATTAVNGVIHFIDQVLLP
ncbi:uncharacterized protein SYNPCC7002_A0175-like [Daphnia carinata]|uniref:uncharacterized protein SYNPCC7002_A0175-like n=1 Tax=Daphnia carinata TaxID=120202 RepID=UPI00257AF485|nr:uncharacterized protein SYNPCC7002_A0175-like [Daphnia carinata]